MSVYRKPMVCDSIRSIIIIFLLAYRCNSQAKESDFKDNCSKYGQICINYVNCSNTKELIESKQALPCGFRDEISKRDIKICCNPSNIIPAKTSSPPPSHQVIREQDLGSSVSRNSTAVALQKCQEYGKYRYVKKWQPPLLPGENGNYYDMLDCVTVQNLMGGSQPKEAETKEYPHMALIGYGKELKNVSWDCSGSLISEKFIMSPAHCTDRTSGPPRWVLLGHLNRFTTVNDALLKVYSIVKVYNHPNYKSPSFYHDISLLQLNTTVEFSPHVRPACLYTTATDLPIDTRASLTGWGNRSFTGWEGTDAAELAKDTLLKSTVTMVDHQKCRITYAFQVNRANLARGYDSNTMICADVFQEDKTSCKSDSGGSLQILTATCTWNVIGVTSFGPGICENNNERHAVYTKVSYYLDWIQSIVWP